MQNLDAYAKEVRTRINDFMAQYLSSLDNDAVKLKEAMNYGLLLGGKRARPLLVYATGEALGQKREVLDYVAAAVECIHAYSLIHDDMPEMDNDVLRRGQQTVHVKFGQTMALLAGDALQTLAFEFVSDKRSSLSDSAISRLTAILAKCSGYAGMCGGQALDLLAEGQQISYEELRLLHSKKTGALIRAAVMMGAQSVDGVDDKVLEALDSYATSTGRAFQVWDDILDVIGDAKVMGKTQGADESLDKSTYPALMGLEEAKIFAKDCAQNAIDFLKNVPFDTSILTEFALFTVDRDH